MSASRTWCPGGSKQPVAHARVVAAAAPDASGGWGPAAAASGSCVRASAHLKA